MSSFNKVLNPYWNKHLTELCKNKKSKWIIWTKSDKPVDEKSDLYREYKCAKAMFRRKKKKQL